MKAQIELKTLHPKQKMIAHDNSRYRIVACGRRFGKTEMSLDVMINLALDGKRCWWLSPVYSQSTDVWQQIRNILRPMGKWCHIAMGERNIYFPNGGYIGVRSAHNYQNLRGTGLDFAVLDEAAFYHPDVWQAVVRPMLLERKGSALFASTPYGRNWFWDLFVLGQDETEANYKSWQFSSYESPILSNEEIDTIKQTTPEQIFRQEYLAEFIDDAGLVFRNIANVCVLKPQKPYAGRFAFGVDWGRYNDYTVISIIDMDTKQQVFLDRFNRIGWDFQRQRIVNLYQQWQPETIIAESNSIGEPNIEALQAEGLPVMPFQTTAKSKAPLIEALSLAIENEDVMMLDDTTQKAELLEFGMVRLPSGNWRYEAPPGKHDDCVIASALSWSGCNQPSFDFDFI